jgi:Dyp-type peroxidase family
MPEPALKLDNIQGNILAGFNKDFQRFLFINFPQDGDPKGWLKRLATEVASSAEVASFNALFKQINQRRGGELGVIEATWSNVALSASGLEVLGLAEAELAAFPETFRSGMAARAETVGDTGANAPEHWIPPFGTRDVHAILLLASDSRDDLNHAGLREIDRIVDHHLRLLFVQDGTARSDLPGHEHFGFKDGVSQPGVRGFTLPSANNPNEGQPGQDLLWPGEFVLGYPKQKPHPNPPPPIPGPPHYGGGEPQPAEGTSEPLTEPGPIAESGPDWTADGSYLVFRRLRQDVAAFNTFVNASASAENRSEDVIGAKLVGRYKSGCPLERTADEPQDVDPQAGDPSLGDPTLLIDAKINNFEYHDDADGGIVPRAAHIRKAYPRDEATPGGGEADTQTHRLLRRGVAYGAPYDGGAPAGSPQAGDAAFPDDRGLLFLCYQTSIENQFEFVQNLWVDNPNFPVPSDGEDPIIAQRQPDRKFAAPGLNQPQLNDIPQFVTTTAGEYFFAPSIAALEKLGA